MALYLGNTKITPIISKGTSTAKLITKSVDSNGVYSAADDDADGYSKFTVNVQYTGQEKTLNPSKTTQIIVPDSGYNGITKITLNPVTSSIDENIISSNIKQGVSILGVTGTLETKADPVLQSKTITPTKLNQTITPDTGYDALSSVIVNGVTSDIDSNITAGNIKEGVSILGITGTLKPVAAPNLQNKSATPLTTNQTIEPDEGYDGLSYVSISKVDSSIDSNIVAGNIKKDISILGVTGTYEGDGSGEDRPEPIPISSKQVYEDTRPSTWPYIPMPSEMGNSESEYYYDGNQMYALYDASTICPVYISIQSSYTETTLYTVTIDKFMNTTLVSTETINSTDESDKVYFDSSSVGKFYFMNVYSAADTDWNTYNFIRVNIKYVQNSDSTSEQEIITRLQSGDYYTENASKANQATIKNSYLFDSNYSDGRYYREIEISIYLKQAKLIFTHAAGATGNSNRMEYFSCNNIGDSVFNDSPYLKCCPEIGSTSIYNATFRECYSLITAPEYLSEILISNPSYMFKNCYALKYIPNLDLNNSQSTQYMFSHCENLEIPPHLSNTSKITDISYMFEYCYRLKYIPTIDYSSVTNIKYAFYNCMAIEYAPLINLSKCTSLSNTFNGCILLKHIPNLNTSTITDFSYTFNNCKSIIEIPSLDFSKATTLDHTFGMCNNLRKIGNNNINAPLCTRIVGLFYYCYNLEKLNTAYFPLATGYSSDYGDHWLGNTRCDLGTVTLKDGTRAFYNWKGTKIDSLSIISPIDLTGMFRYATNYNGELPTIDCSNVTSIKNLTEGSKISKINLTNVTSNLKNASYFSNSYLKDTGDLNFSNLTSANYIFNNGSSLARIRVTGIKLSFSISSTNLSTEALVQVLNDLADLTGETSQTLTMGSNNLARLNDTQKAIATNKNWTLA